MLNGPMIVINSSPVINLFRALDSFEILPVLYGTLVVPLEVIQELEVGRTKDAAGDVLRQTRGVEIRNRTIGVSPIIARELDIGEAAVIETALREHIPTVVLDEIKARRLAKVLGLNVTGSLGVLIQAKRAGRVEALRPAIQRMRDGGTWLDEALVEQALRLAGEA